MDIAGGDGTVATNTDLLLALKDEANEQAWVVLCARYQPVLISFGRRLGLSEPDAQDAAQESLFAFARSYRQGQYDRSRGRLRAWLFSIASHKVRDAQRKLCRQAERRDHEGPPGIVDELPDDHHMSHTWELEWQRAILDACLEEAARHVESSTIEAFRLYVLQEKAVDEVAAQLNMTRNAVFKAQRRVLSRIREIYDRITNDE